jgi:putative aldouronate transport system permease protein
MTALTIPKRLTRIQDSMDDRVFMFLVYLFVIAVLAVVLYPVIYIVSASVSDPAAVTAGKVGLFPVGFTLRGYEVTLQNSQIVQGYLNSLFYTVAGTLISVTLTVLIAYPLSRRDVYGANTLLFLITFTMIFSGGLIPTYLVVKDLGMINTRWALLIPQAIAPFQVIIARTFFRSAIPDELVEAAEIDGCSDLRFLWSIVLPLSKPIIAVLALMYAVSQWNGYFDALLYLKSPELQPLQLVLRNILILNTSSSGMLNAVEMAERRRLADLLKYCLVVVASVPVMIIYPFVQRYFVKGMLIGSIKG